MYSVCVAPWRSCAGSDRAVTRSSWRCQDLRHDSLTTAVRQPFTRGGTSERAERSSLFTRCKDSRDTRTRAKRCNLRRDASLSQWISHHERALASIQVEAKHTRTRRQHFMCMMAMKTPCKLGLEIDRSSMVRLLFLKCHESELRTREKYHSLLLRAHVCSLAAAVTAASWFVALSLTLTAAHLRHRFEELATTDPSARLFRQISKRCCVCVHVVM